MEFFIFIMSFIPSLGPYKLELDQSLDYFQPFWLLEKIDISATWKEKNASYGDRISNIF